MTQPPVTPPNPDPNPNPIPTPTPTPTLAAPVYVAPVESNPLTMLTGALVGVVGIVLAISHVVFNVWMLLDPTPSIRIDELAGRLLRFVDGSGAIAVLVGIGLMLWPDRTSSMLGRIVFGIWILGTLVGFLAEQRLGYPGYFNGFQR